MAKYLKLFNQHTEYQQYMNGDGALLPNVSICKREYDVHYNPKTFYIYHTSDCTIEKVTVDSNCTDYDIVSNVKEGFYYGGYFKDYLSKGTTAQAIMNGEDVEFSGDTIQDEGGENYHGDFVVTSSTNPQRIYYFDYNNAHLVNGRHMNPVNGEMYFLKEDLIGYFNNYFTFSPSASGSNIELLITCSAIPSANYNKSYLSITEDSTNTFDVNMNVASTLTINNTKFTAKKVFVKKGLIDSDKGYMTYVTFKSQSQPLQYINEGHSYTFIPKAETYDGVEVVGSKFVITINSLSNGKYGFDVNGSKN